MYCKQCHEPPWSQKKIVLYTRRILIFAWNSSFASWTIQCPERYCCSLLRSFPDWTSGTRLPCVHSFSNSVCQGPVYTVFSMFSLARATWRGALAISDMSHNNCNPMESSWDLYPLIWRIQKRRQRCRRRLLKSAPSHCEWVCAWACAFARLPLHLSPLLGGLKFRVSLHQLLGEQALVIVAQMMDPFLLWTPKFYCKKIVRLAFFPFVLVLWSGNACRRNIRCLNLVLCKFEIQSKSYRVIVMKCCPPASSYFSHDELSGISQKLLRCKVLEFCPQLVQAWWLYTVYPGPLSTWKGPSKRCLSSCDFLLLVGFLFWSLHIPTIWFVAECGQWHFDKDDQLSTTKGVDMNVHYGTNSSLATRHKLDSHSFRSIVLTNLGARIFAVTIVPKTIRRCNGCAVGCRETFCCSHE